MCAGHFFFLLSFFFPPHPRLSIFSGDGQPSAALEMSPPPHPPDMFASYMRDERRGLAAQMPVASVWLFFFFLLSARLGCPPPAHRENARCASRRWCLI